MQRLSPDEIGSLIEACKANSKQGFKLFESKYEPWMCDFCIEFAKQTGAIKAQLAAALNVSWSTFCAWRSEGNEYYKKEFADAIKLAETYAKAKLIDFGVMQLINPHEFFNATLYQMLGRYAGEFSEHRAITLPLLKNAKSHDERIKVILDAASDGVINTNEAQIFANTISTLARVEEITELKNTVLELKKQLQEIHEHQK